MSALRIIGLVIGIIGLFLTLIIYRGPKWKKPNFIFFGLFSLGLISVSLSPDILNATVGMLKLDFEQRGRIIFLAIASNIFLWFLLLYTKTKFDSYRHQFDLLIRNLGHEDNQEALSKTISKKDIVVIIPAYNEADNLKTLLPKIPKTIRGLNVGVLVVDDGGSDYTSEIVREMNCMVVRNKINRGQGAALRLGYDIVVKYNVPYAVTMDADNQHQPEEIQDIIKPILEKKYDLVLGARTSHFDSASSLRRVGVFIFTLLINLLTNLKISDCSSGFKAFRTDKMKSLRLKEEQFQSTEVILLAAKNGLRVGEVPITISNRRYGNSKKGSDLRYGINFGMALFRSWWR